MPFVVEKIQKVRQNWKGQFERSQTELIRNFDIALSTRGGQAIIRKNNPEFRAECFKCSQILDEVIICSNNNKHKTFRDFEADNFQNFFEIVQDLVTNKNLEISVCCQIFDTEKGWIGDAFCALTWNDSALNLPKQKDHRKINGLKSEKLKSKGRRFRHLKCECPNGEHCSKFIGTSSFSNLGIVTNTCRYGINMINVDFDDYEEISGHEIIFHAYTGFIFKTGKNHFWIHLSILINDGTTPEYYHTIVVLVTISPTKKILKALVIDPNENQHILNGNHSEWLEYQDSDGVSNRNFVKNFLTTNFNVKTVTFGTNRYGAAHPKELFFQYPNDCNIAICHALFWLALGFKVIPRFNKSIERGLFCRLRRVALHNQIIPALFTPELTRSDLEKHVLDFIHE